jgi:16S rRNA (cytosine967-C5)-methyltransferase
MKPEKDQSVLTTAQRSLRDFLTIATSGRHPGEVALEGATPLVKNLWFTMNRHRAGFDWLVATHCKKIRPELKWLLRWALTESLALDALPPAIAVSVAVDEAKQRFSRGEANFINALLRRILSDSQQYPWLGNAPASVKCELPEALYQRWKNVHGEAWVDEIAKVLKEPAKVTGRRRGCFRGARVAWPVEVTEFVTESSEEFNPAEYYLQDASTLMAPLMLGANPGETIADLCAAPGGKSLILAELLDNKGVLYSCDASEQRLGRLRENLLGFSNVRIEKQNAERPKLPNGSLDGLLLDVPCSNTGVIRRRPDVRWNFAEAELSRLVMEQKRILEGSCALVRSGGRLVYSTCSIEEEENAKQVRGFLKRHPEFTLAAEEQLLPTQEHDGAYSALLLKI